MKTRENIQQRKHVNKIKQIPIEQVKLKEKLLIICDLKLYFFNKENRVESCIMLLEHK